MGVGLPPLFLQLGESSDSTGGLRFGQSDFFKFKFPPTKHMFNTSQPSGASGEQTKGFFSRGKVKLSAGDLRTESTEARVCGNEA